MTDVTSLAAEMEKMQVTATVLFALAVVHTFCVKKFLSSSVPVRPFLRP